MDFINKLWNWFGSLYTHDIQYLIPIPINDLCNIVLDYMEWTDRYDMLKMYNIPIKFHTWHYIPTLYEICAKKTEYVEIVEYLVENNLFENCDENCHSSTCGNFLAYINTLYPNNNHWKIRILLENKTNIYTEHIYDIYIYYANTGNTGSTGITGSTGNTDIIGITGPTGIMTY